MKIYCLFLFIIFSINFIFGQARLFSTESQIKSEFSEMNFKSGYLNDGARYISFSNKDIWVAYSFNKDGLCDFCSVKPKTQGLINATVERFNKQYVIISDREWKFYSDKGIMYINLEFVDQKAIFHYYTK